MAMRRRRRRARRTVEEDEERTPYALELKRLYYDPSSPAAFGGVQRLVKQALHFGIPKQVTRRWLANQTSYSLHKPVRRNFQRRMVKVNGIDDQWQADLVDMQFAAKENDGYNYFLTVIDVLSKYAWVVPLKQKTGEALVEAFEKIFRQGRKPRLLQTDAGTEFLNSKLQDFFKKENVKHFVTYNETKAQIAERFNRTLKEKMFRYFQYTGQKHRYIDVLQDLVDGYNHSYHRSIKMKPAEVNAENAQRVREILYAKEPRRRLPRFRVGDHVRLTRAKNLFEKGYDENWTEEVFTVTKVVLSRPPVYKLKEYDGTEVQGTFYEQELQRVKRPSVFRIERILRRRGRGRRRQYFVKWRGYPNKYNSWVDASSVGSSVPRP